MFNHAILLNTFQVKVETDLISLLRANDASNPSTMYVVYINDGSSDAFTIGWGYDYTGISYVREENALRCIYDGIDDSACGSGNLPAVGALTEELLITEVNLRPQDGSAFNDQYYFRLRFTWSLTSYLVYAQMGNC